MPVSIWKGVRVLVEPANVIIINGDDSTTGLPRVAKGTKRQSRPTISVFLIITVREK